MACPLISRSSWHERRGDALGNADLFFDQVDSGDHFANRMFHLYPGIHFQEIEGAGMVHEELHGPRVGIPHSLNKFEGTFSDLFPGPAGETETEGASSMIFW